MPRRWLYIAIRLAERGRRHETTSLLGRRLPERTLEDRVVTHIRHRPRRLPILQEHETSAHRYDLALTVRGTPHDRRQVLREYRRCRLERQRGCARRG